MAELFDAQKNAGFALTLKMTAAAPAIANRIFDTYDNALSFVQTDATAIAGLILSVIDDSDANKNGAYYVASVGENGEMYSLSAPEYIVSGLTDLEERVEVLETAHTVTGDDLT